MYNPMVMKYHQKRITNERWHRVAPEKWWAMPTLPAMTRKPVVGWASPTTIDGYRPNHWVDSGFT